MTENVRNVNKSYLS